VNTSLNILASSGSIRARKSDRQTRCLSAHQITPPGVPGVLKNALDWLVSAPELVSTEIPVSDTRLDAAQIAANRRREELGGIRR